MSPILHHARAKQTMRVPKSRAIALDFFMRVGCAKFPHEHRFFVSRRRQNLLPRVHAYCLLGSGPRYMTFLHVARVKTHTAMRESHVKDKV